jgi:hypothetical protein
MAGGNRLPQELVWFTTKSTQVAALTQQAVECVESLDSAQFSLGRLAFNSPRLLGGQAGRMGLSCASCHPAGRANTEFFVQQISDVPGQADISHHFLSSQGGDKFFNPKVIPDLADVDNLRFPNRNALNFDQLLTRLIEIEFDGSTPNKEVFEGLKLYLSRNDIKNCERPNETIIRNLESDWQLIDDGLNTLDYSIRAQDLTTTEFVSASMRAVLESFYRFYGVHPTMRIDKQLKMISRTLQSLPREEPLLKRFALLGELSASLINLKESLHDRQPYSFYNAQVAQDYLNSSGQK